MKLYYAHPSRAVRPRWLLEEIGAPYDLVRLDLSAGEQKRPEYLALNPNGTVPTLVDGDLALFESAAICQYLADKFPERGLAPPVGTPARGLYYQWVQYAMSNLDPQVIAIFHHTIFLPEVERIPAIAEHSRQQLAASLAVVERALTGRPYIVGDDFTAADVVLGSTLVWARELGFVRRTDSPATVGYLERLTARPGFQRAAAD